MTQSNYRCPTCQHNNALLSVLIDNVLQWADDREILTKATTHAQMEKTLEEVLELSNGIHSNNYEQIIDGIGDVLVTLIIQAKLHNLTLTDCLLYAFNEIKNRKGEMVNGTFVKEKE